MLFVIATVLVIVATAIWWKKDRRSSPPGPWGLPLLGYLPWLDPEHPYETLTNLAKQYGPIYAINLGTVRTIVLSDHKIVKQAFMKDAMSGRAPLYVTHGIMKGQGLICAEGDLWKDQRKFTSYCLKNFGASKFGSKRADFESLILKYVENLIKEIKSKMGSDEVTTFDPFEDLRHSVGTLVFRFVFGRTWEKDDELWKFLLFTQEEGVKLIGISGPLNFLPFLRYLPKYKKSMDFLVINQKKTHKIYSRFIEEEEKTLSELIESGKSPEPATFIQAYLLERQKDSKANVRDKFYSDFQMYHYLADLFGAALDTTLTTIRWYMLYMAAHPRVQDKVFEELSVLPKDRLPSLDDLPSLPYTKASIAESQRIRSVVPLGIPHGCMEDVELEGYVFPKGSMVVPLQWAMHMDETHWPNPEEFNPERFINAEGRFFKPDSFMPFQTGKRMCVGDELAKMMLFFYCSSLIKTFAISVENEPDLTGECGITLNPKPYTLRFALRP